MIAPTFYSMLVTHTLMRRSYIVNSLSTSVLHCTAYGIRFQCHILCIHYLTLQVAGASWLEHDNDKFFFKSETVVSIYKLTLCLRSYL
jgi:hypothetical protein